MNASQDVDLEALPDYVRERWPVALERATAKTNSVQVDEQSVRQLIRAAQRAPTVARRVAWLHRAASPWERPLAAVSACKNRCSHCCHIPVVISGTEAQMIGRHVDIKPTHPTRAVSLADFDDLEGASSAVDALKDRPFSPCPFLKDGACSVYEVRPMVCRLLVNLDDDDLLCRLVPQNAIPVPYANAQTLKGFFLLAQPSAVLADIRDYFPADPK